MQKDDQVLLHHMLDAAREAVTFTYGRTRADLDTDRKLTLALVKDIEIVGEAAYRISKEVRDVLHNIPWADIIGMRHRLVHAYYDINLDILWQTVQHDLPSLIDALEPVVRSRNS